MNETNEINVVNTPVTKSKKKFPKKLLILIPIVLIIILIFGYYFVILSPRNILNKTFDAVVSKLEQLESDNESGIVSGKIEASIDYDNRSNELLYEFAKIGYQQEYDLDLKNSLAYYQHQINYGSSPMFNFETYQDQEAMYMKLPGYDNYIKNTFERKVEKTNQLADLQEMTTIIQETLLNNIEKEDLKKEIGKITIKSKKKTALKTTLIIDKNNYERIVKKTLTDLIKNEQFITILSKNFNLDSSEIKTSLEENTDKIVGPDQKIEITLSTNLFNKFLQLEITDGDSIINLSKVNEKLYYFNFSKDDTKFEADITIEKSKFNKGNKTTYQIKGTLWLEDSKDVFTMSIIHTENDIKEISKPDLSSAISTKNITEQEMTAISNEVLSNEALVNFASNIAQIVDLNSLGSLEADRLYNEEAMVYNMITEIYIWHLNASLDQPNLPELEILKDGTVIKSATDASANPLPQDTKIDLKSYPESVEKIIVNSNGDITITKAKFNGYCFNYVDEQINVVDC